MIDDKKLPAPYFHFRELMREKWFSIDNELTLEEWDNVKPEFTQLSMKP
jgi:hypothetical protein